MSSTPDVATLITGMAQRLTTTLAQNGRTEPLMIGIRTGGVWVAERLHEMLEPGTPLGSLNINFYRDDFTRNGLHPQVTPSDLPFDVDDRHVVLVDDVLFTGRTIRAALNEVFDYGRPASVTLVALISRNGRELPVMADVSGAELTLEADQYIKLNGPEPLSLSVLRQS